MQVTYELIQKDFYEALIAHRNRKTLTRWSMRGLIAFAVLALLLAILMLVLKPDLNSMRNIAPLLCLVPFWCVLIWGAPWWSARVQYRNQPAAKGERTLITNSEGYQLRWSSGRSEVEWRHFVRWLESKSLILLYSSPVAFDILPKRAFTPQQLDEFRTLLTQNVNQK